MKDISAYHVTGPEHFARGFNLIDSGTDPAAPTGIEFGILRLASRDTFQNIEQARETIYVLLDGAVRVSAGSSTVTAARTSIFETLPWGVRAPEKELCRIETDDKEAELAVAKARTTYVAEASIIEPHDLVPGRNFTEPGKDVWNGSFHRIVRTMFTDGTLTVGETVARSWSSYPPHHHPQPEIYFYRFDRPQGYAFAEIGDAAVKVRNNSLTRMVGGVDHSQSCAPGYTEYYLWVILNMAGVKYVGAENAPEHEWVLRKT